MFIFSLMISYMSGLLILFSMHSRLLLTLIGIEFLTLLIYLIMFYNFLVFGYEMYFLMIMLVMMVSKRSLWLSVVVGVIRCHGNDLVNSLFMMMW